MRLAGVEPAFLAAGLGFEAADFLVPVMDFHKKRIEDEVRGVNLGTSYFLRGRPFRRSLLGRSCRLCRLLRRCGFLDDLGSRLSLKQHKVSTPLRPLHGKTTDLLSSRSRLSRTNIKLCGEIDLGHSRAHFLGGRGALRRCRRLLWACGGRGLPRGLRSGLGLRPRCFGLLGSLGLGGSGGRRRILHGTHVTHERCADVSDN